VTNDDHCYLAYSPKISIEDSSEPCRASLGAILSVVKDVPIASSPDMQLGGRTTVLHLKMTLIMLQECIVVV
jgi:hypothetical protein